MSNGNLKYKTKAEPNVQKVYTVPSVTMFVEDVHRHIVEANRGKDASEQVKFDYIAGTSSAWILNLLPILGFA